MGKRPAGKAIRALLWLGPEQAGIALQTLRSRRYIADIGP
jgi:hypothetical protein